jgi:hypothetical protein
VSVPLPPDAENEAGAAVAVMPHFADVGVVVLTLEELHAAIGMPAASENASITRRMIASRGLEASLRAETLS